jgi:glycosyltransferase involved in cell wall biosynthesis
LKVLVVTNLYPPDVVGGYELGCSQMVGSLREHGVDARVAAAVPRVPVPHTSHVHRVFELSDNWSPSLNAARDAGRRALHLSRSYHVNAFNIHALLRQLDDFHPDAVYLWSLEGIGGLAIVACLQHLRVPWVWHLMDQVPVMVCSTAHGPHPALLREFNRAARGTYLACSQTVLDEIARGGVTLADDVEVVPNWIHGALGPVRERYLPDGTLRVMHAAAQLCSEADKGTNLIVDAAARLLAQGLDRFSIDLYGNTPDQSIRDMILTLGLQDHVRLMGWRSQQDLKTLHREYDLFAFPTRPREPFAFSPLEASAAGCVPLLSQVCGNSEWFVHGVHVVKCDRAPDEIARALAAIIKGDIALDAIGARTAAAVRRDFHIDAVTPRVIAALKRAAARPRLGAGLPADAFRLAMMAERMTHVFVHERMCA